MKLSRMCLLLLVALAVAGMVVSPKHFILGGSSSVVLAQTKGQEALNAARAALNQANEAEKLNPTKQTALAADLALQQFTAAVTARVSEIQVRLKELVQIAETTGKSVATQVETAALEAELGELQPKAITDLPSITAEVEPNNTTGTANPINLTSRPCAIVSGAIDPVGDTDFFSFTATAGARIWILADTGGTQIGTSRDSIVDLIDTNGTTLIETDDDDGTGNGGDNTIDSLLASVIASRVLPSTGTYFIRVRHFSGTATINPYRLFVTLTNVTATAEVESNDSAATANPITTGSGQIGFRSGSLSPGDNDFYSIVATAGDVLFFSLDDDPGRIGTSTGGRIQLRDVDDSPLLLCNSGSSSGGFDAEGANFTILTSGTYFVRVFGGAGSSTGPYTVMVSTCTLPCTLTCPANITQTNDPNQCGAVVTYPPPTTTGACGAVICSPASGSFFPLGTTTVTCQEQIIAGPAGQIPSCSFTISVTDDQPPTITCPANITVPTDPNLCSAVVTYPAPTVSDNCGVGVPVCSPASGVTFPKGTTTVTCTVADTAGNTGSCSFTVTVNDAQSPTITCPANITVPTDPNLCSAVVTYPAPMVNDNCGVGVPVCSPASGVTFPKGTTTVTCTVADTSGNTGRCSFTVTVNDTQPPTITCPANITAVAAQTCPISSSATVNFPPPTVSDNCPGVTSVCSPASGSIFPVGTTTVTCTATDTSGNTATCSFTVTVFSGCLQDDSNPANVVLFNATTGEYRFCCGGTIFSGVGTVLVKGCTVTIQHNPADRRVLIKFDGAVGAGTASLQSPPGSIRCTITDRNTKNNACACP